jgi:hypothetical protein
MTPKEAELRRLIVIAALAGGFLLPACTHTVKVEHDVKPIHLTVDINLKVQRELEDFFDFEDKYEDSSSEGGN